MDGARGQVHRVAGFQVEAVELAGGVADTKGEKATLYVEDPAGGGVQAEGEAFAAADIVEFFGEAGVGGGTTLSPPRLRRRLFDELPRGRFKGICDPPSSSIMS